MNLVALIGNVATAPELRYTTSGKAVCSFRMAVSRPGGDQADFVSITTWERQAEVCDRYLEIGRRVGIEGRLHHSTWESKEGRRSTVEVVAHRVQLLGAGRRSAAAATSGQDGADVPDTPSAADVPAGDAPGSASEPGRQEPVGAVASG